MSESFLILNKNHYLKFSIIFIFIGTIFFLVKFPLYRYGYSYPVSLFILIINFYLKKIDKLKLVQTSKVILMICVFVFFAKQLQRYVNNIGSDFVWPKIYSFETNQKIN